jgi:large-conductance mechanosensitive channel
MANLKEPEGKGLQTPQQRGFATVVVKLIIISLNILMIVMIIGKRTRRERKRQRAEVLLQKEGRQSPRRQGAGLRREFLQR